MGSARTDAAHGAHSAGGRLAHARHSELGLARIRQSRRLLALRRGLRCAVDSGGAGDQWLGAGRLPAIVRAAVDRNWEFIGHGLTQRNMQKVENERADIRKVREVIANATGKPPRGWLGPGLTETWETPDLLVEEGYDYVADWVLDDQPVWLKTRSKPILNLPYTQECNDVAMMLIQHHKASEYSDRALDQFEQIYADSAKSARVMALVVHPYIMGAPHRLKYFRRVLETISQKSDVKFWTSAQIADWYKANYPRA